MIKFWLAKEVAEILVVVAIFTAVIVFCLLLDISDKTRKKRKKRSDKDGEK